MAMFSLYLFALAGDRYQGVLNTGPKDYVLVIVNTFFILSVAALPVWLLIIGVFIWQKEPLPRVAWAYLLGLALIWIQLILDPFHILVWYTD